MKKLVKILLTLAALSFAFNFASCSGGSSSSSDDDSYESGTTTSGSGSGSSNPGNTSTNPGNGGTGIESGNTTTQNAFTGKTFVTAVLETNYSSASSNKAEACVTILSFNSEINVTQSQIRSLIKNGTVKENKKLSGENCTYSVSGSTATIATSEGNASFTLSSDGKKLTNNEGNLTLADGTVYAYIDANVSSKSKANVQIIVLGSGGKGKFTEKSSKNGTNTTKENFDFTYTLSGSNFSLKVGSDTATGTLSSDKKKLTIDFGDEGLTEYTKL